jgi:hypothetical protein
MLKNARSERMGEAGNTTGELFQHSARALAWKFTCVEIGPIEKGL